MPWNECKPMDERLRFIARLLEGEKMAPLCREFSISRVAGYKIFERYKACGLDGLHDRSKAPYRQASKLPFQVERAILGIKKEFPCWGAPKIRDKLIREIKRSAAPIRPRSIHRQPAARSRLRIPITRSAIAPSASRAAGASAWAVGRST